MEWGSFLCKTGKYLKNKETSITIKFCASKCRLQVCPTTTNSLKILISPEGGFYLGLNLKAPDSTKDVQSVFMRSLSQ